MFSTIIRTFFIYFIVIFSVRIMGKRQVGDLQPGELVVTILISEIAAMPLQDADTPILLGVIAILTLVVVEVLTSFITMKSFWARRIINGSSAVIIRNGELDQKLLKSLRLTVPDVMEVLRGQNVFDISDVSFAILETNGNLSVLLKSPQRPATQKNLSGEYDSSSLPLLVISDGKVIKEQLRVLNKTKADLINTLKKQKLKINDVFLMTLSETGATNIIIKEGQK